MGFFTNKVKSIIKQKVASNLISGFQNAAFGQPKKLAAKLANKSPLDMSKSPVAHMGATVNPYNYGIAQYPQETTNLADGHYIIFDVIENKKTSYGKGGSIDIRLMDTDNDIQHQINITVDKDGKLKAIVSEQTK